MKTAVYPGSFDPITEGHLDIIRRSSRIFDKLIVLVLINPEKKSLFDIYERKELIEKVTHDLGNVEVETFEGLLVHYMKEKEADVIIKGLRAVTDFEYEFQMSLMNRKLSPTIETFFMMTSAKYSYLSSSAVKQVAMFGGDLKDLIPEKIINDVINKIKSK
ncbi:pantetheine-phosphate adenylyltransferase [Clostridium sp. DL1XJH146]